MPIFGASNLALNQYLESVNDRKDANSIIGVFKSQEERKNRACADSLKWPVQ